MRAVRTIQHTSPSRGSIAERPILANEVSRRPIPAKSRKTNRYDRNPMTLAMREVLLPTCLSMADRMLPIHLSG